MLVSLSLENFALIERLTLEPAAGLTVLTGETGAGKSIIVEAVGLLLGGRAFAEYIRAGAARAGVTGVFSFAPGDPVSLILEHLGLDVPEDLTLLLSREISSTGKNTCRINGRQVTLGMYQEVARALVDIHGQHEQQLLFSSARQMELLDAFGSTSLTDLRGEVEQLYRRWQQLLARQRRWEKEREVRDRELELRRYQLEELDRAGLVPGEREVLEEERRILSQAERLRQDVAQAVQLLHGGVEMAGAADELGRAENLLEKLAPIDSRLAPWLGQLQQALYQVEDVAAELRRYAEQVEFNPQRLEEVTARLDFLQRLERKYGRSVAELLAYRQEIAAGLENWQQEEENAAELEEEIAQLAFRYDEAAGELSRRRRQVAAELEEGVAAALRDLGMPGARIEVSFQALPDPQPYGREQVEFLLAANPGEPPRPLARVASGGELSRIMLALKSCLAAADSTPTLIFDEIDAGIGGRAAQAVGRQLAELAKVHQVLCVTHLPQIASFAGKHFVVSKETIEGRTIIRAVPTEGSARLAEIARMLAGEVTPTALRHAGEVLDAAATLQAGSPE